jgi:glutamyl-tRNA(Gln) amidotransferase subunit E
MDKFPENAMIGLEVHMQVNVGKLFCHCPPEGQETGFHVDRHLRTTSGEGGIVDISAKSEEMKNRSIRYLETSNSCLVDLDEKPPETMNRDALSVAMALGNSFGTMVLDRISVMRKIVIDGSNTSGFQRTSVVGFGGTIKGKSASSVITTICLEEDSCRKIEDGDSIVTYSLERLGIPLIEISTNPDMKTPEEAMEIAREIGNRIMIMGMLRKGADSIRQDVNFSMGFGRVEIKGVSKLTEMKNILVREAERQDALQEAVKKWKETGGFGDIDFKRNDQVVEKWSSKMILKALEEGKGVYISILKNGRGFLKNGRYTMGREIADALKLIGIRGIIHFDELPAYGINEDERDRILKYAGGGSKDSFLLLLVNPGREQDASLVIRERLEKLFSLNFSETRAAMEDGTTRYMRPLSGSGRMYPETDIPIIKVDRDLMETARELTPGTLLDALKMLQDKFGLSGQDAETIVLRGYMNTFSKLASSYDGKTISRILLQKMPEAEKKFGKTISLEELENIVSICSKNKYGRYSLEWAVDMISSGKMNLQKIMEGNTLMPLETETMGKYLEKVSSEEASNLSLLQKKISEEFARPVDMSMLAGMVKERQRK